MSFWSVKDFATGFAAKIASFTINTDQNASAHVIVDSTGAEVIGTKADAAWDGSAATPSSVSLWKYMSAKLEAMRALLANPVRTSTLWTDDTNTYFVRIDNGTAISWTTISGTTASAPGTGARPASAASFAIDKTAYQAIAAATGYSIGDFLDHYVITDPNSGAVVGHFWLNTTTEAKLASAPASGNITPISASGGGGGGDASASNQVLQTAQATALNTVLGTKADATWDGAAAASGVSIWRYVGVKLEAIRALIAAGISVAISNGNVNLEVAGTSGTASHQGAPTVNLDLYSNDYPAAAGATTVLGSTGAQGDYLAGVVIVPGNTSPGSVQYRDGSKTPVTIFAGGASSVGDLRPFTVPLGIYAKDATTPGFHLILGADVTAVGIGKCT